MADISNIWQILKKILQIFLFLMIKDFFYS